VSEVTILNSLITRIGVLSEKRTVYAGPVKTSYLASGSGNPVLLLHGAGKGGIQWYTVIGPLSREFSVIAPDIVGYGESDKPSASYDREFFVNWLCEFVDALNLDRIDLVGTSQGGAIALQFALENPERVSRLVLVNSAGLGEVAQNVPVAVKLRMMWHELFPSSASSEWFLRRHALFNAENVDQGMLELEEYGRAVLRMPGGRRAFWQGRGRAVEAMPVDQLKRIMNPTLLIWGEEDCTFPLSSAVVASELLSNARVEVISKAGHICFLERPTEFNQTLREFLIHG